MIEVTVEDVKVTLMIDKIVSVANTPNAGTVIVLLGEDDGFPVKESYNEVLFIIREQMKK